MTTESDATLAMMIKLGMPITRENYIEMNWLGSVVDPLPAELDEELPEQLRMKI